MRYLFIILKIHLVQPSQNTGLICDNELLTRLLISTYHNDHERVY